MSICKQPPVYKVPYLKVVICLQYILRDNTQLESEIVFLYFYVFAVLRAPPFLQIILHEICNKNNGKT